MALAVAGRMDDGSPPADSWSSPSGGLGKASKYVKFEAKNDALRENCPFYLTRTKSIIHLFQCTALCMPPSLEVFFCLGGHLPSVIPWICHCTLLRLLFGLFYVLNFFLVFHSMRLTKSVSLLTTRLFLLILIVSYRTRRWPNEQWTSRMYRMG